MPVSAGGAAAGAALGAYGGFRRAQEQNRSLEAQAELAELNADILLDSAGYAQKFAWRDELNFRNDTQRFLSAQKAAAAATGFSIEAGSIRELLTQSQVQAEGDAFAIRFRGEFDAFKKRTQARTLRTQARLFRGAKVDPFEQAVIGGITGGIGGSF